MHSITRHFQNVPQHALRRFPRAVIKNNFCTTNKRTCFFAQVHLDIGTELFNSWAVEQDGEFFVTTNQLKNLMTSLGGDRSKEVIWDIMMMLDVKRDGKLDYEEFISGYDYILSQTFNDHDVDDIFRMLDTDNSGDIDRSELTGLLLTTGGSINSEDANELVKRVDQNCDGSFSKKELAEFLKQHPGWLWKLKACFKTAFLIGPPGGGKGVICAQLVKHGKDYINHVSSGELLRSEIEKESELGISLKYDILNGKLVPSTIITKLLRNFLTTSCSNKFTMIDGFPRNKDNLNDFIEICGLPTCAIVLECPDEIVLDRILKRGVWSDRPDDNEETAKIRIQSYHDVTKPVIKRLEEAGVQMIYLDATLPIEENSALLLNLEIIKPSNYKKIVLELDLE